jgi:hypothetical protein
LVGLYNYPKWDEIGVNHENLDKTEVLANILVALWDVEEV